MSNVFFSLTSPAYSSFSRFIKLTLFEFRWKYLLILQRHLFAFAVWPLSVEILSSVNEYAIYIQCNTTLLTRDTKSIYSFADYANSNWPWEGDVAAEEDAPSEFARLNACINFCCLLLAIIYIKYTHTQACTHIRTRAREWTRNSISCREHGHIKCFTDASSLSLLSLSLSLPCPISLSLSLPTSPDHSEI